MNWPKIICVVACWQGQDGLPQIMSTRRIGTGSRPLQAYNAGATETLVINPKAGLQARHVSYATGVNGNNLTYHSNSSGRRSTLSPLLYTRPSIELGDSFMFLLVLLTQLDALLSDSGTWQDVGVCTLV